MRVTRSQLTRAAAMCAVTSGLLYIGIQLIHPDETLDAVTKDAWAIVGLLTLTMAVLGLVGVTGIYLRQVEETGILGLIGFISLGLFFLLTTAFTFAESLILPLVVADAPEFVENFMGIFNGAGTDGTLGALESIGTVAGGLYVVGGLLLGIAIFRSHILWSWAAILLALGALLAPLTAVVPHELARYAAVPVGLALVGLGYSLWTEQGRATSPETREAPSAATTQPTG